MISLTLNHQRIKAKPNQTILDVIKANSVNIPTLCHLPGKSSRDRPRAVCRICVVEVKGVNGLVSACSTKATQGMEIFTHSKPVLTTRKVLMEFTLAEHQGLKEGEDSRIRQLADEIGVKSARFTLHRHRDPALGRLSHEKITLKKTKQEIATIPAGNSRLKLFCCSRWKRGG